MNKRMFWAYVHSNSKLLVKPWFGDRRDYSTEPGGDCHNNDFVKKVIPPFEAENQEEARKICENLLIKEGWRNG